MKNLTDIEINQSSNKLTFVMQVDSEIDLENFIVFVDECDNMQNMYSDQSENHSYYFNKYNSEIEIVNLGDFKYQIIIQHENIASMSEHMKYFKILSGANNYIVEGVYYKSSVLFDAELTHIKRVCNMCLDDNTMQLIVHVVFKRLLLESALETDDCNKCMVLYIDLCRLLHVSIDNCCCTPVIESRCVTCAGGCCSLK